jgi:TetR/AcrR family transcriptional regulator
MPEQIHVATQTRGSRRQPQASRKAILKAALAEFGQQGLAGARMDTIASAAGVNKALLYYYFRSKEELYAAVLDDFFQRLRKRIDSALDTSATAGERILLYARAHFDSVAESPYYARLFQGEIMNAGRDASSQLSHIVEGYIVPIATRVGAVLQKGIRRREFRAVDPLQFAPTMAATIVFYFVSAPVIRRLRGVEPYAPEEIAQRRAAVLDFIAAALFVDRAAGLKLAAEVATHKPEAETSHDSTGPKPLLSAEDGRRK